MPTGPGDPDVSCSPWSWDGLYAAPTFSVSLTPAPESQVRAEASTWLSLNDPSAVSGAAGASE